MRANTGSGCGVHNGSKENKKLAMYIYRSLIVLFLGLTVAACSNPGENPDSAKMDDDAIAHWNRFVDDFIEGYFEAHPVFAVWQGNHAYDGQLPDWSREGLGKEIARLEDLRKLAQGFGDDSMDDLRRYQRDYLISRISRDLFWLDKAELPYKNPAFYFDWMGDSLDPSPYVTLTYAPPAERLEAITDYLHNIPEAAAQIRENLATPMPATYVEYGISSFGGLADYFDNELVQAFAGVRDQDLQDAFNEARRPAVEAMNALRTWLEGERERATTDFALGADLFRQMVLDTEGVDVDLGQLEEIARADLKRNTDALRKVCEEYAPGQDIPTCFAKMADNKPETGAVQAAKDQLSVLKKHVVEQDLVSVPSAEEAQVREAPPYARSNFAYINIPGPYEQGQPSIYFIAPPDPSWPKEVQRAYLPGKADLLFTSVHEVWPGHFLQFLHAQQSDWVFGRLFVGYGFGEGWAHYTEEMMIESGYAAGDPETRIGQLSNALLRNTRFLSALGLHTSGMSVAESEQLFMEEGFQDEGTARQQAARGTYDPAFLNYNMGKLMIKQLREDWTKERGGREAWKEFHDTFLSYGGPPIPLVRAQMLGGESEAVFWSADN